MTDRDGVVWKRFRWGHVCTNSGSKSAWKWELCEGATLGTLSNSLSESNTGSLFSIPGTMVGSVAGLPTPPQPFTVSVRTGLSPSCYHPGLCLQAFFWYLDPASLVLGWKGQNLILPWSNSPSVTDTDGTLWVNTSLPHPTLGLRLVLYIESQSCPAGWSSSSHGGNLPAGTPFLGCLPALPHFPSPLPEFPGTHFPNQLLPAFLTVGLPKLTGQLAVSLNTRWSSQHPSGLQLCGQHISSFKSSKCISVLLGCARSYLASHGIVDLHCSMGNL